MLFPTKINVIFGISTSNTAWISKIYAEKQVTLHSLTFTKISLCHTIHQPGWWIHFTSLELIEYAESEFHSAQLTLVTGCLTVPFTKQTFLSLETNKTHPMFTCFLACCRQHTLIPPYHNAHANYINKSALGLPKEAYLAGFLNNNQSEPFLHP